MATVKRVEKVSTDALKAGDVILLGGIEHLVGKIQRDPEAPGGVRSAAYSETVAKWVNLDTLQVIEWTL